MKSVVLMIRFFADMTSFTTRFTGSRRQRILPRSLGDGIVAHALLAIHLAQELKAESV